MAPVQEMSDARQALKAAEEVGARTKAAASYEAARQLLNKAETALEDGEYGSARKNALAAKEYAIEARQRAVMKRANP